MVSTFLKKIPTGKLAVNFLSLSFIQAANYLIPLFVLPFVVRIIGPEKFGVLTFAQTFVYYFTIIINYSFDYTATRDISRNRDNPEKVSYIYTNVFYCKSLLFIFATISFSVIAFFVTRINQNLNVYLVTYLINVGFVFFPSWFFQGVEKLTNTAIFNFLTKSIFAALIILLLKEKSDYLVYTLSLSISQIIVGLVAFMYGIRYYKIRILQFRIKDILNEFKRGLPVFFSNIAISLYTTTNLIILGFFETEQEYGYFSAALKVATITHSLIVLPLGLTLFPHIGLAIENSQAEGLNLLKKYFKWVAISTFLLGACIFVFAGEIILILFGSLFSPGVVYLRIMAFMPFVSGLNNLVSVQGLLNLKKDKEYLRLTIATFVFSLILNIMLVPTYKSLGTSVIQLLCEIFMVIVGSFVLFRVSNNGFKNNLTQ